MPGKHVEKTVKKGPATKRTQKFKKSSTAKDKATKRENSPTTKKEIENNESEPALGLFHSDKVPEDIKWLTHHMDDMLHRRYSYGSGIKILVFMDKLFKALKRKKNKFWNDDQNVGETDSQ